MIKKLSRERLKIRESTENVKRFQIKNKKIKKESLTRRERIKKVIRKRKA